MNVIGVICEYNPMHTGHLYQIKKIKEMFKNSIIVIVTNSCFTQRGDISIINKWDKTRFALENQVDLVVELPFVFSCQSADVFANGAIKILNILGIDTLVFGSESNNIELLKNIVNTQLYDDNYNILVKKYLDNGYNYPTALSKSLESLLGYSVNSPNDLLAISYIKEVEKNKYNINVISIKRTNSYHSKNIDGDFANASLIREKILKHADVNKYIVPNSIDYYYKDLSLESAFSYLKYQISISDLKNIQTVDEGIENRIKKCINNCNSWEEFVFSIKTKRYTYNKVNRMLLHILTNFTKGEAQNIDVDYIRILGFSINGQKYLNKVKKNINIPVLTHYKKNISKILDIEYRINSIYSYIVKDNKIIEYEINHKPVIYKY